MKILEFKILKIFYLNLIALVYMLPSFGGAGGGLYAQDPQLFEHTWYFVNGEINGEEFLTPDPNFEAKLNFEINENGLIISHPACDEQLIGDIEFHLTENEFILFEDTFILIGVCGPPLYDFIQMHYNIYYEDEVIPKNTFYYTIENFNDYLQLTIENGEGDWAVYNSLLLSTLNFSQTSFTMYPNPVKEILHINNSSKQKVSAKIYDIRGKKLKSHFLETNASLIDVKTLIPGLYLVVFESEVGERVSKKFIKH